MATKLTKRNTPLKSTGDADHQTPTKVLRRSSRSSSRSKSCENEDNSNDAVLSPAPVISTRRSTRIIARRSNSKSVHDSSNDDDLADVKELEDEEWECEVPAKKSYFNENPDDYVHGYKFKTPKKKDGMVALAYNTPKRIAEIKGVSTPTTPKTPKGLTTPRTPKTPKSSRKLIQPKTPSNVRARLQKGN